MTAEECWTYLEDNELFTANELQLITNMNGYSIETFNNALFARYGYRSIDQWINEE